MTSQHGAYELHAGEVRLHAHAHAPGHPHLRTHSQAHTDKYVILDAYSTARIIRLSVRSYVRYMLCFFF
jgi:hypothetical protein